TEPGAAAAVLRCLVMSDEAMTASDGAGRTEQLWRQLEADAAEWSQRAEGDRDAGLLDKAQLRELDAWLTPAMRGTLAVSGGADAFIAASRAARRRWWPGNTSAGTALAILLILLILATPITLLSIVGFTAALIHRALN